MAGLEGLRALSVTDPDVCSHRLNNQNNTFFFVIMAAPFPNVYHLRTVAETSSKPCLVCYKPTCKVLITPNNKVGLQWCDQFEKAVPGATCANSCVTQDFFYTCVGHLSDAGFASPVVDAEAEAAKKKKELMDKEIEKVKQEYEERQRLKKSKKKSKDDDKDQDNSKAEKERDEKVGPKTFFVRKCDALFR